MIVGKVLDRTGPKFFLFWGMLVIACCLTLFGLIDLLTDPVLISCCAILLRFTEGLASGSVATSVYSIASNDYPDEMDTICGNLEAALSFGMMIAPLFGAIVFSLIGY